MELRVQRNPWSNNNVEFLLVDGVAVGTSVVMKEVPEGQIVEPTFKMNGHDAQKLFDELWLCGFRPNKNQREENNSLKIMETHLNDMRKIVSKIWEIDFNEKNI